MQTQTLLLIGDFNALNVNWSDITTSWVWQKWNTHLHAFFVHVNKVDIVNN